MSKSGQESPISLRLKALTEQLRADRMDVDCVSYDPSANGQLANLPTELILEVASHLDEKGLCKFASITFRNWVSLRMDCHRRALKVALPTPEEYKQFEKFLTDDEREVRWPVTASEEATRTDINNRSKFVTAVCRGHLHAAKSFLEHGVDPNAYSIYGNRMLLAAGSCHIPVEMTQLLLTYGADPKLPDVVSSLFTPLYTAAISGQDVLARILMNHGADVKQKGAIHILCQICTKETVQFAIERGADLHQRDNSNNSVVHSAARNEDPGVLGLLFDLGIGPVYIHSHNSSGKTPLLKALKTGRLQNMRTLLDHGADPDCEFSPGMTALHKACHFELVEEALLLIEAGASINAVDGHGRRPLHFAAAIPSTALVQRLVQNGADVTASDHQGDTALHIVCSRTDQDWVNLDEVLEIVKLLVAANAPTDAQNSAHQSPLSIAMQNSQLEIAHILFTRRSDAVDGESPGGRDWNDFLKRHGYQSNAS